MRGERLVGDGVLPLTRNDEGELDREFCRNGKVDGDWRVSTLEGNLVEFLDKEFNYLST